MEVISITRASISKVGSRTRSTAIYSRIPVTTQIIRTEVKAPSTSARYQPKGMLRVAGLEPTHKANNDIIKLPKSVNRCAASVAIAKLLDSTPPANRTMAKVGHLAGYCCWCCCPAGQMASHRLSYANSEASQPQPASGPSSLQLLSQNSFTSRKKRPRRAAATSSAGRYLHYYRCQ